MKPFVPDELWDERMHLMSAQPIEAIDAWTKAAKMVIELKAHLAATKARLAEYEVGFDPKVHPVPDTWVLMKNCDDEFFPVIWDSNAGYYWNYRGASNGNADYDFWYDDNIDLRKWFPLPGSKGGEA